MGISKWLNSPKKELTIITWFVCFCLSAACQDKSKNASNTPNALQLKLDSLLNAFVNTGLFNGSVLVAQEGNILINKGYGYSDLDKKIRNSSRTRYPLYSITKSMTATLVLRLTEKGMLTLDDKLSRFYPSIPDADRITIKQLLTHTSGLYPYNNDFSMPTGSEAEMIRFLSGQKLRFPPGTQWEYCNTGYYLLGFIIEKTTALSFRSSLENFIFQPLKMFDSGMDFRVRKMLNKAKGYQFFYPDSFKTATLYNDAELRSAGGVWSTVEDVYRFHQGMQEHRIISDSLTEKAYTPFKGQYGYGWFIDSLAGKRIVSHSGGAAGFRTYLVRVPETNTCIVLLANAENIDLTPLKNQILHILFNLPYEIPVNISLSAAALSSFPGVYQLEPGRSLYITQLRQRLIAQISGQQPVLLLAVDTTRFTIPGLDGYLEFFTHHSAQADSTIFYRKGRRYSGYRTRPDWGICGSALPGGWDAKDIPLHQMNGNSGRWVSDTILLQNGVVKFRYNNDWTFNLGEQLNSPMLVPDGQDIRVNAGSYLFLLDLSKPGKPSFKMTEVKAK